MTKISDDVYNQTHQEKHEKGYFLITSYKNKNISSMIQKPCKTMQTVGSGISNIKTVSLGGNICKFHCVKCVRIWGFSGPYFPAFELNAEICRVNFRIQLECGKIQTRKTPDTDTLILFYSSKNVHVCLKIRICASIYIGMCGCVSVCFCLCLFSVKIVFNIMNVFHPDFVTYILLSFAKNELGS